MDRDLRLLPPSSPYLIASVSSQSGLSVNFILIESLYLVIISMCQRAAELNAIQHPCMKPYSVQLF